jgi:carbon storage regulator CsrA
MLVLSRRPNETLVFVGLQTTVHVVSIKKGVVRLGVEAPEHVRVLRGELPDRDAEWADLPPALAPPLPAINSLVEKRLAILRCGLDEIQRSVSADRTEETELLLDKLDEDLRLFRQRLHTEADRSQGSGVKDRTTATRRACVCDGGASDAENCRCAAATPRPR